MLRDLGGTQPKREYFGPCLSLCGLAGFRFVCNGLTVTSQRLRRYRLVMGARLLPGDRLTFAGSILTEGDWFYPAPHLNPAVRRADRVGDVRYAAVRCSDSGCRYGYGCFLWWWTQPARDVVRNGHSGFDYRMGAEKNSVTRLWGTIRSNFRLLYLKFLERH